MARGIPLTWFLIGGAGILYLLYAKKSGLPPFNAGGLAEKYLPDFVHPAPIDSGDSQPPINKPSFPIGQGGGGVSLPPPLDPARMTPQQMMAGRDIYGNPVKPGTNPFEAPMAPGMIDLGSGYQMANPNGTPNSFGSGASRATQFQSTVANDPTPTNYGIYTQYLNGLRNEYLQMDEQRRIANAQDIGIGGDITTLPQPPVVGATPFNYPTPNMQPRPPSFGPPQLNVGGIQIPMGGQQQVSVNGMPIQMMPGQPMYNPATAAGAMPYPQYGAPAYAQGPILGAPRSPYFGSFAATEKPPRPMGRPPGNVPPEFDNQIQHFQDMAAKFDAMNRDLQQQRMIEMAAKFQNKDLGVPQNIPVTHPAHPNNRFVDPRALPNRRRNLDPTRGRRWITRPPNPFTGATFPAASTSVVYDEDMVSRGPADLTGIKPTLFNMVSRNQPGGLKGQKIGNVR